MLPVTLTDAQGQKLLPCLRSHPKVYIGAQWSCRQFLSAVLWMTRSGAQWRLLPKEYGHWNSIYKRFARWCAQGVWEELQQHCVSDPDLEHLLIDATIVRAHPCAAGAPKKARRSRAAGMRPKSRWIFQQNSYCRCCFGQSVTLELNRRASIRCHPRCSLD